MEWKDLYHSILNGNAHYCKINCVIQRVFQAILAVIANVWAKEH